MRKFVLFLSAVLVLTAAVLAAEANGAAVYFFGGLTEDGRESDVVYRLDLETLQLTEREERIPMPLYHGAGAYDPAIGMVLFGGISNGAPVQTTLAFQPTPAPSVNLCASTLSMDLTLLVPSLDVGGSLFRVRLQYDAATPGFGLLEAAPVEAPGLYSGCVPATASLAEMRIHLPVIMFAGGSYWADLLFDGSIFSLLGAGPNL